jgi:hypothetical protein
MMMVRTTPYRLLLKLSWDSKRSASSDVTLQKEKKSPLGQYSENKEAGGLS